MTLPYCLTAQLVWLVGFRGGGDCSGERCFDGFTGQLIHAEEQRRRRNPQRPTMADARSSNIPTTLIDKRTTVCFLVRHQAAATLPMHKVNSWVLAFREVAQPRRPKRDWRPRGGTGAFFGSRFAGGEGGDR